MIFLPRKTPLPLSFWRSEGEASFLLFSRTFELDRPLGHARGVVDDALVHGRVLSARLDDGQFAVAHEVLGYQKALKLVLWQLLVSLEPPDGSAVVVDHAHDAKVAAGVGLALARQHLGEAEVGIRLWIGRVVGGKRGGQRRLLLSWAGTVSFLIAKSFVSDGNFGCP